MVLEEMNLPPRGPRVLCREETSLKSQERHQAKLILFFLKVGAISLIRWAAKNGAFLK